ncbi:hypothetical protein Ciccas_006817 [Cichlidogyrus casuarinus]|uniref:Uncharacterized protein n=1 Tax=Cichlidogyrus casuarinus TaxID=1844966 RepID=A0ABD2Q4N1_9PLAT
MKNYFSKRKLLRLWIGLIVFGCQCYVLWISIYRYLSFKTVANSEIFGDNWNFVPLHIYLYVIVIAVGLALLLLVASSKDTGNWANDHVILGRNIQHAARLCYNDERHLDYNREKSGKCFPRSKIPQALLPFNAFVYFLLAFMLLLPLPWLNGESIRHGAIDYSEYLSTMPSVIFRVRFILFSFAS